MSTARTAESVPLIKNQGATSIFAGRGYRLQLLDFYFGTVFKQQTAFERAFGIDSMFAQTNLMTELDLIKRRSDIPQFVALREAVGDRLWQGGSAKQHFRKMVRDWNESALVAIAYDRLRQPQWKKRFTVRGTLPEHHPDWGKRPVIFTYMHTGCFGILRFWLRSQGYALAALAGGLPMLVANKHYEKIAAAGDEEYGLTNVPQIFHRYGALREGMRFLTPGHALLIAIDGGRMGDDGEKCEVDGFPILIKQGAARMAAQTNAILIPVSVRRTGFCRFEVHYHDPVPDALVTKQNSAAASQNMVSQLWTDLRQDPTELTWTTLEEMAPALKKIRTSWP